jgi:putative nucleotidyltransferase with HDIG domain
MMSSRVFIVDSDRQKKNLLAEFLAREQFQVSLLGSISGLLFQTKPEDMAVALVPLSAPAEEDISQLRRVRKLNPWLSVIALLGSESAETGLSLIRQELVDQVASPDNPAGVFSAVNNSLALRKLVLDNSGYLRRLKVLKTEQSRNRRRAAELEESYNATLENLMTALDLRDVETFGHSLTVAKYCQALAKILGITEETALDNIRKGALLHDIGKIAIPDAILKKPGRLSGPEWEKIKLHPVLGYGLIKEIKLVREVGNIILYHHERYDGGGYPKGLHGEAIPQEARIFALADALDAITSHRPYRKERDFRAATKDIQDNRGRQFDPAVVDAFCTMKPEDWERIRYETTKVLPAMETFSQLYNRPGAGRQA